jgi:hypothetical protein
VRSGAGQSVSRSLSQAAAVADRRVTELSREVPAELAAELACAGRHARTLGWPISSASRRSGRAPGIG